MTFFIHSICSFVFLSEIYSHINSATQTKTTLQWIILLLLVVLQTVFAVATTGVVFVNFLQKNGTVQCSIILVCLLTTMMLLEIFILALSVFFQGTSVLILVVVSGLFVITVSLLAIYVTFKAEMQPNRQRIDTEMTFST